MSRSAVSTLLYTISWPWTTHCGTCDLGGETGVRDASVNKKIENGSEVGWLNKNINSCLHPDFRGESKRLGGIFAHHAPMITTPRATSLAARFGSDESFLIPGFKILCQCDFGLSISPVVQQGLTSPELSCRRFIASYTCSVPSPACDSINLLCQCYLRHET
jgi:hypothetical protein